jgi:hypothetical protein
VVDAWARLPSLAETTWDHFWRDTTHEKSAVGRWSAAIRSEVVVCRIHSCQPILVACVSSGMDDLDPRLCELLDCLIEEVEVDPADWDDVVYRALRLVSDERARCARDDFGSPHRDSEVKSCPAGVDGRRAVATGSPANPVGTQGARDVPGRPLRANRVPGPHLAATLDDQAPVAGSSEPTPGEVARGRCARGVRRGVKGRTPHRPTGWPTSQPGSDTHLRGRPSPLDPP